MRFLAFLSFWMLGFVFLFGTVPAVGFGEEVKGKVVSSSSGLETIAKSAVLMDEVSGEVLFAKNPDHELPMASVTKLMTMLIAVEEIEQGKVRLNDIVTVSENAWRMGGSQVYLEPGEEMSMKDMLIAIGVGSANDASVAVAEHIAGSVEAFVEMMNEKAEKMGLKHTHFVNTTGLPAERHYTSAYDMALILRESLQYQLFREISSIYEYDLRGGEFKLWNTNKLLRWYKGTDVGKTGWTNEARYCLASSAVRNDLRLIVVVLGTPEPRSHFRESMKIYNYGFARYKGINIAEKNEKIKMLQVDKGEENLLEVVTEKKVSITVPKGEEKSVGFKIKLPEKITAPIKKGDKIGNYFVTRGGKEILMVNLIAGSEIPKASIARQIMRIVDQVYRVG